MKSRNPVLPLEYHCPDGEPHFINGELFVYPSFDVSSKSYCSDKLYVAHSKNLTDWVVDGPAFESSELDWEMDVCYPAGLVEANKYEELPGYIKDYIPRHFGWFVPFRLFKGYLMWIMKKLSSKDKSKRLLYAPDSMTIGDKSYLFFCTSDNCEGVAVSDNPAGPFTNPIKITTDKTNTPIKGIDPGVFRDDDGKAYIYWGQINSFGAELTENLTKVKEDTIVMWTMHGIYGCGIDMDEAFGLIETVEKAAKMYLLTAHLPRVNTITDKNLFDLAARFNLDYRRDFLDI